MWRLLKKDKTSSGFNIGINDGKARIVENSYNLPRIITSMNQKRVSVIIIICMLGTACLGLSTLAVTNICSKANDY